MTLRVQRFERGVECSEIMDVEWKSVYHHFVSSPTRGRTPLHLAASEVSGPTKIIKLLLEAKAMTEAKDLGGREPQSSSHGEFVFGEFSNAFSSDMDSMFHLKVMKNLQPQTGPGQNIFFSFFYRFGYHFIFHFFSFMFSFIFFYHFIFHFFIIFLIIFYHFIFHFFIIFYHFFYHFFFQWCKKNQKMENCNFPRVFSFFYHFCFRWWNWWKMIKNDKKW